MAGRGQRRRPSILVKADLVLGPISGPPGKSSDYSPGTTILFTRTILSQRVPLGEESWGHAECTLKCHLIPHQKGLQQGAKRATRSGPQRRCQPKKSGGQGQGKNTQRGSVHQRLARDSACPGSQSCGRALWLSELQAALSTAPCRAHGDPAFCMALQHNLFQLSNNPGGGYGPTEEERRQRGKALAQGHIEPRWLDFRTAPWPSACPGSAGRGGSAPAEKGTSFKCWNIHLKLFYLEIISN